jgi:hypothetical protein
MYKNVQWLAEAPDTDGITLGQMYGLSKENIEHLVDVLKAHRNAEREDLLNGMTQFIDFLSQ